MDQLQTSLVKPIFFQTMKCVLLSKIKENPQFPHVSKILTADLQIASADFARRIGLQKITVNIVDSTGKYDAEKYGSANNDAEYYQNMIALLLKDLSG
ncbi:unnamed protein product [Caenorhabditis angaria]|uniref:Uncharacterized protein n=1 Tax=Caenorhabditis angaria TaxID=860376 RepID=A0A9P1IGQ5_9PELO|nr:unnamed protein product [Caenorhabditis angaria]